MKLNIVTLTALLAWASAAPQDPQVPSVSTSITTITVNGQPAPTEPIPNNPNPVSTPAPAPAPAPAPSDPSQPKPAPGGAHCVCGATYCGKVLVGFQGYTTEQVGQGYCATPGTNCASAAPAVESLENTLFVCICPPGQKQGSAIELICPCQGRCKNDEPDFIGRCETPCNLGCAPAAPSSSASAIPAPVPVPVPVNPLPAPVPAPAPPPAARRRS
ncbi:hypothetical protein CORC01_01960 [Colletotrichum orchidophilum]|uniref:Uncharacterized protein n=1 Tax=Colletotrichum orchidophilum TaxID=1209926 RepID=A0A1G4BN22_9PEZI|nr:uncharacterized protein CORC01_01960 [Colletotrichum orchidophilum]OHF02859.1 hypothetical protein CORC01_01960 [Colletotrichum orchidophilum]